MLRVTYENSKRVGGEGREERKPGRDFMYTSRGNGYTSHITDCYCTLARFYKALKILFVIKFPSSPPTHPLLSLVHPGCTSGNLARDKGRDDSFVPSFLLSSLFRLWVRVLSFFLRELSLIYIEKRKHNLYNVSKFRVEFEININPFVKMNYLVLILLQDATSKRSKFDQLCLWIKEDNNETIKQI